MSRSPRRRLGPVGHGAQDRAGPADRGNAYEVPAAPEGRCPRPCGRRRSGCADRGGRDLFGAEFVDHYAATREWEERQARKAVTDWQLARYFEII